MSVFLYKGSSRRWLQQCCKYVCGWSLGYNDIHESLIIIGRRLTERDISCMLEGLDHTHLQCYICGPPTLITFVSETLLQLGVEEKTIHYEQWWK